MLNAIRTSEAQVCYVVSDFQFDMKVLVSSFFNELNCFLQT